jgi:hypothetical protein
LGLLLRRHRVVDPHAGQQRDRHQGKRKDDGDVALAIAEKASECGDSHEVLLAGTEIRRMSGFPLPGLKGRR